MYKQAFFAATPKVDVDVWGVSQLGLRTRYKIVWAIDDKEGKGGLDAKGDTSSSSVERDQDVAKIEKRLLEELMVQLDTVGALDTSYKLGQFARAAAQSVSHRESIPTGVHRMLDVLDQRSWRFTCYDTDTQPMGDAILLWLRQHYLHLEREAFLVVRQERQLQSWITGQRRQTPSSHTPLTGITFWLRVGKEAYAKALEEPIFPWVDTATNQDVIVPVLVKEDDKQSRVVDFSLLKTRFDQTRRDHPYFEKLSSTTPPPSSSSP